MPPDDLEREVRDLFARILEAGRRSGERAATERIVTAVRAAARPDLGGNTEIGVRAEPAVDTAPNPASPPSDTTPAEGAPAGRGADRLPPYWRPR